MPSSLFGFHDDGDNPLPQTTTATAQERRTRRMLELMSAPKKWEMGDGEVAEVSTPWTDRAKELQVNENCKVPTTKHVKRI